jgi:DNA-binding LacI/PurR family transcriptional regulator
MRVMKAIEELGYYPNAFARGLRARRTNTIGFIVDDYRALEVFRAPYSAGILTGMTAQLKASGFYLLVYPLQVGEDLQGIEALLRSGRLDGLIARLVPDPPTTDALMERIVASHLPCVCIEQPAAPRFDLSAITYDDRQGAYEATRYLLGKGHRRVAHLLGDQRYPTARNRLEGYQRALADHGLVVDEALVSGGDWLSSTARASITRFLALAEPPSAIFAANDSLAIAAIEELRSRGVRVPQAVAVIGFDDIEMASWMEPALTTVRIPLYDIGQRAAEQVLAMLQAETGEPARVETVPLELIHRKSA